MADYALTCPRCQGPMWNQQEGKFPWKPGTPIAKCKNKECASAGGVYWEDSKAGAKNAAQSVPKKTVRELDAEEMPFDKPAPVVKEKPSVNNDVLDYFNILISVIDKWEGLVKDLDKDLAATTTFADLKEISTTIYIQRAKRG